MGTVITAETAISSDVADKLHRIVGLSEVIALDALCSAGSAEVLIIKANIVLLIYGSNNIRWGLQIES